MHNMFIRYSSDTLLTILYSLCHCLVCFSVPTPFYVSPSPNVHISFPPCVFLCPPILMCFSPRPNLCVSFCPLPSVRAILFIPPVCSSLSVCDDICLFDNISIDEKNKMHNAQTGGWLWLVVIFGWLVVVAWGDRG